MKKNQAGLGLDLVDKYESDGDGGGKGKPEMSKSKEVAAVIIGHYLSLLEHVTTSLSTFSNSVLHTTSSLFNG